MYIVKMKLRLVICMGVANGKIAPASEIFTSGSTNACQIGVPTAINAATSPIKAATQ